MKPLLLDTENNAGTCTDDISKARKGRRLRREGLFGKRFKRDSKERVLVMGDLV
jgi:NAD(P)H-flavin reductase